MQPQKTGCLENSASPALSKMRNIFWCSREGPMCTPAAVGPTGILDIYIHFKIITLAHNLTKNLLCTDLYFWELCAKRLAPAQCQEPYVWLILHVGRKAVMTKQQGRCTTKPCRGSEYSCATCKTRIFLGLQKDFISQFFWKVIINCSEQKIFLNKSGMKGTKESNQPTQLCPTHWVGGFQLCTCWGWGGGGWHTGKPIPKRSNWTQI